MAVHMCMSMRTPAHTCPYLNILARPCRHLNIHAATYMPVQILHTPACPCTCLRRHAPTCLCTCPCMHAGPDPLGSSSRELWPAGAGVWSQSQASEIPGQGCHRHIQRGLRRGKGLQQIQWPASLPGSPQPNSPRLCWPPARWSWLEQGPGLPGEKSSPELSPTPLVALQPRGPTAGCSLWFSPAWTPPSWRGAGKPLLRPGHPPFPLLLSALAIPERGHDGPGVRASPWQL